MATVNVVTFPVITITVQPALTTNVTTGSISGSLSVAATVTQNAILSYQWYSNSSNSITGGTLIFNATSAGFAIPTNLTSGTYYYFVEVRATGGAASVRSNPAAVVVSSSSSSSADSVTRVLFSGPSQTVTLSGLVNNDIYLVKVNTTNNMVNAGNTGGPSGSSPSFGSGNVLPTPDEIFVARMGHPGADVFHANPPPFERKRLSANPDGLFRSSAASANTVNVTTKRFWVETVINNGIFTQIWATLRAQGEYGNIWVMNDLTTFTGSQAQEMASQFDEIYPLATTLLGFEYGGGLQPGDPHYGGWDSDPRIQILVYDIGYNPAGTTLGYFWAKDMRLDTGSGQRSNEAEMFYMNGHQSVITNFGMNTLYSTLVHEFQHMIHWSQKNIKHGVNNTQTWYNEMLSMIAEDLISPLIGIPVTNTGHPVRARIPGFLTGYHLSGITEWGPDNNPIDSYAVAYAFGAFLLRNYGGANLLKEILANNSANIASVTAALRTVSGDNELSFEEALRRFGEALIYSGVNMPAGVLSFDKTDTKTINTFTYTAAGFNVWSGLGFGSSARPRIFGLTEQVVLRPHSLTIHQPATGWTNRSGDVQINLQRPNEQSVEFYLMVK